jgi:hypothetical protein
VLSALGKPSAEIRTYFYGLTLTSLIMDTVVAMFVVAAICPTRNCAALVLVSRTDAKLNIAAARKEFELLCPFCRFSFRASASDLVARKVSPVWLLIRYDRGDSVAGVYLDGAGR